MCIRGRGYNWGNRDGNEQQAEYPLRPEMAESAWYMYQATKDPVWQQAGMDMVDSIDSVARVPCGFAAVKDVRTHQLEDVLDSFFFAETLKYLFLLFEDPASNPVLSSIQQEFVMNTEGHILRFNQSFFKVTESTNFANHACRRPSALRRLTTLDLQPLLHPKIAESGPATNKSVGCAQCGHPVAEDRAVTVDLPPSQVEHKYVVTAHGSSLVHVLNHPEGHKHELVVHPPAPHNLRLGPEFEEEAGTIDRKTWREVRCGNCGALLGYELQRAQLSNFKPTKFTGCLLYTSPSPRDS
eukprot:TRINITY_DN46168_c0_g1_i1.p1 TRINITY_DN46168_c0_g1~~TRINITY_DN46168_c0_g1_i1.p1  ORF type:complete len:297 (-),score=57.78 TRINITY_DN46168_c0_g1_i1:169-1059(-)